MSWWNAQATQNATTQNAATQNTNVGYIDWGNLNFDIDYDALSKLTTEDIAQANETLGNTNSSSSLTSAPDPTPASDPAPTVSSPTPAASDPTPAVSNSQSNTGSQAMANESYQFAQKVSGGYNVQVPDYSKPAGHGTYQTTTKFIPDDQVTVDYTRNTPQGHGIVSTSYDISVNDTPKADTGVGTSDMYINPEGEYGQAIIGASEISYPGTAETERIQGLISSETEGNNNNNNDNNNTNANEPEVVQSSSTFNDTEEYQNMLSRIEELEKMVAANNATASTISKGSTARGRSSGLIDSVISSNSLLTDSGSMKIGGQVYGPDGSTYPSVTDAIQAGVYNYTYFPISTGVKQENKPLTRRTLSAPTETPTTPMSSIFGVN